jgi:UDP-glucose 4-epimerase
MKILITGSSGHLGEALVRTLKAMKHQTIGIDILPSEFTDKVGSIDNRKFVQDCMKGVSTVIHTATLHKPHIVTHSKQNFVDTNIIGTLNLLEEALSVGVKSFVFTSTTSTFGDVLTPSPEDPAVWVTEELIPVPKNIYGVTKIAAEDLCRLFNRDHNLPCIVLRTSRFFPEEDDNKKVRHAYQDANIKANEFLYRRVDIEDVVSAHIQAMKKAIEVGFGRYIISATTPFSSDDLMELRVNASMVLKQKFPDYEKVYSGKGWKMLAGIDRVYVNERARIDLGWQPKYDFQHILERLKVGGDYQSPLSVIVGSRGYHSKKFKNGPYPV